MRIRNASLGYRMAAMLAGIAMFFAVAAAHATIATKTADALANNPNGGPGLVQAIADIFDTYRGKPEIIARVILHAAEGASDEQMAALGQALGDRARALKSTDPAAAQALEALVAAAQIPALQESFDIALVRGEPGAPSVGLGVPSGGGASGGGLDVTSAN